MPKSVEECGLFFDGNSFHFRTATSAYPYCILRSTIRRAENCLAKDGIQRKTSGKFSKVPFFENFFLAGNRSKILLFCEAFKVNDQLAFA